MKDKVDETEYKNKRSHHHFVCSHTCAERAPGCRTRCPYYTEWDKQNKAKQEQIEGDATDNEEDIDPYEIPAYPQE